ncbi:cyclin-dependent kinase 4 inhibitor D-like [Phymastichus coffea]|uniref:cyclin-dependent kinase 4 inhibitor D-like n=1 Tax=Phymastichus coffea TaxID=108790 RepID=UPI00273BAB71|nr:cyclin-dependent kinase 4 inhibitor D-like [Phymastichus coffea]XP_058809559.1 cyclin-dependent kinase 4 inhibitor D-like [Phymastichus coffea]
MPSSAVCRANDKMSTFQMSPYSVKFVLFSAIRRNDVEAVRTLVSRHRLHLTADNVDYQALRKAIKYDRVEIANLLVESGCRVCVPYEQDNSPLHLAVIRPKFEALVVELLQKDANLSQRNRRDETPIQKAFHEGASCLVIQILFDVYLAESCLNEKDEEGFSYLHIACATSDLETVTNFVEKGGADIHQRVKDDGYSQYAGRTPLHMASEFGHTEVILYLLENGAKIYREDADGSTPLQLAVERGDREIVDLMSNYDS